MNKSSVNKTFANLFVNTCQLILETIYSTRTISQNFECPQLSLCKISHNWQGSCCGRRDTRRQNEGCRTRYYQATITVFQYWWSFTQFPGKATKFHPSFKKESYWSNVEVYTIFPAYQALEKYAEAWSLQNRCLTETDDQPCPIANGGNAQKSGSGNERAGKKNGGKRERRQFWQLSPSVATLTKTESEVSKGGAGRT